MATVVRLDNIDVQVEHKNIKRLYLRVYRATGKVKISAPLHCSMGAIQHFARSKLAWIRKQQKKLEKLSPPDRGSQYEYRDGETHYFQGQAYLLKVEEKPTVPAVEQGAGQIKLNVRPGASVEKRGALLDDWYRCQLEKKIGSLIARWEKILGVSGAGFRIRKMKTRWGSCSPASRTFRFNLALAKTSAECLEYVVVHELVHLLEPSHNHRFHGLMDQFLPAWRAVRKTLNSQSTLFGK